MEIPVGIDSRSVVISQFMTTRVAIGVLTCFFHVFAVFFSSP